MTPNEWHRPQAAWAAQSRCSECGASKAGLHEPDCQVALAENPAMRNARTEARARMNDGARNATWSAIGKIDDTVLDFQRSVNNILNMQAEVRDYRPARKSAFARFRRWLARLLRFDV